MLKRTTIVTTAAVLVSGAALAVAGASMAGADEQTPSTASVAQSGTLPEAQSTGTADVPEPQTGTDGNADSPGSQTGRMGPGGGHQHTTVSGDELAKVSEAVKAKDAGVSVTSVQKDPDGSYDVHGTKDGSPVMVEVSQDLATMEVRTGGMGRMGALKDHHRRAGGPGDGARGQASQGADDAADGASPSSASPGA